VALAPDLPSEDGPTLRRPPPPRTWRDRVEHLADATGTTPARLLVGAVAAAGAVIAGLWLTRPPVAPPETALPFASTTASLVASPTSDTNGMVVVYVTGAVVAPGVRELPGGARVVDAVDAAGGLRPDADTARINLAAPLSDGERVYVPAVGEPSPPPVPGDSGGAGASGATGGPVNLNDADEAALDALPGIGPATAAAIIQHRQQIGRFTSVEQLLDVRGIGEAKLEQLRPLVTV